MMTAEEYELWNKITADHIFNFNKIMVDIDFLNYIELGKVLSSKDLTKDEFDRIFNIINDKDFVNRKTDDVKVLFDIKDKTTLSNHDVILLSSPAFVEAYNLINNHIIISENNKTKAFDGKKNCTIDINIDSIPNLSEIRKKYIADELYTIFKNKIQFIKLSELSEEDILSYDAFYLNGMKKFNDKAVEYFSDMKLVSKYIFCHKIFPFDDNVKKHDEDVLNEASKEFGLIMELLSRFTFVGPFTIKK